MEKLKGKTILIGKEPGNGRLMVAIAGGRAGAIGAPGCVPNCVSRVMPASGVAHAKLEVDSSGHMTLTNMKSQNVTFVNGSQILSKRVNTDSDVALGCDQFHVNLSTVLDAAKKLVNTDKGITPEPPSETVNIRHLERVYEGHHNNQLNRQKRQKKLGILASASMFFTIGGSALAVVANMLDWPGLRDFTYILPVVGFLVFVVSMYLRVKDKSIEETDAANLEFTKNYVCPKCRKYLSIQPYELMKRQYNMQCPHCKVKFVE